jgi:opacity protein-like surface antigen
MEYWRSNPKFYEPGSDNYPWQKGNNMYGSGLELSSFGLGMGLSFDILKYVNFNLEYGFKNVSSKCDSVFPLIEDKKEWYHRTVADLKINVHKIPPFRIPESMELIINAGFFNSLYNKAFDSWQTEFVHLVPPTVSSQSRRYEDPYPVFLNSRIIGFNAGIRTSFLDRMFGVGAEFIYFTENDKEEKGPGFSIDLSYNLQKPQDQSK